MSLSWELSSGSVVTSQNIFRAGRNGGRLAAKALNEDGYGGPPEFVAHSLSPRPEDYSEIFGSFYVSRASSIPILDLTPADETDVFFDVRSSSFDYTEVFGGLDYQDFAVTYEELIKQSSERNGPSPEEAGTPAENESLSDNSDDSTKTQCIFNGDSNLSCDGCTEFSVSYHRAYQRRKEDMSNGITHVTQISEVPEVTYLVDGTNSPDQDDEIHLLHVNDDRYFNIDLSMGHIEGKQTKKTIPQPPNAVYERQNFENDPQTPKGSDKSNSHLNRRFITISEISLRTEPSQVLPPSRPPPIIRAKKTHHYRLNSDCNHVFPEGISNDSSPPFFDVEVDASSSAAASAEAMKDVMKEARAKLLCAKEMIERKKEGVDTCTKPRLRYDMKDKEGRVSTMLDQSNNGDNEIKLSVTDKTKIVIETAEENQVSLRGEKLSMVANKSAKNKLRNYIDDPREWKEGAGFFQVKPDHSRKASELVKNGDIMIHLSGRTVKTEQDIVIEALEQLGGNDKKIETVLNVHFDKKHTEKVGEMDWQEGKKMRSQKDTMLNCQTEYERSKVTICNYDLEETVKKNKITQPSVEKKGIRGADKSVNYGVLVEVKQKDNKGEAEQTKAQVNDEEKGKVISERKDNENKIKESCRVRENELGATVGIKHLEMKGKLKGSFERTKGEKGLKKIPRQNEKGRTEEILDHLVTEKRLQDDLQEGDDVKPPKKTSDILDGKTHEEDEENGKKDIHERWENILTTHGKHSEEKESKKEPEEVQDRESSQMSVKEAVEHVKIEVTIDKVGNECQRMFEDLDRGELVKFNGMHVGTESYQKTKKIKSTERAQVQKEMGLNKIRTEVSEVDNEYKAMKQHCERDQSIEKVEATPGCLGYKESGDKISECKINNTQLDDARMMHLDIDENVNAVYRGEEEFKHLEYQVGTENINESLSVDDNGSITEMNLSSETKYCNREADKDVAMASNLKPSSIGCELKVLGDNLIITKEAKSPAVEESGNQVKEVGIRTGHQHYVKVKNTSKLVSFHQYQDSKYDQERGEQGKALNLELNKDKFVPTEVDKERIEKGSKCETNAKSTSERKERNLNLASKVNAGWSTARRDGEKNTERVRQQVLEKDRLRKMEEEREREREKDRMIVDRTTLEGRKSDIEVHAEKGAMERAIADAQQRAMLEARERLEKACAEAREKSVAGKAVLEARVRAERAAAERANVEARERAFEKAVAEKSVFESRERIERSFSDKLAASSRNTGIRQSSSFSDTSDIRTQSTFESSGSRYTHSLAHGEIREGIKGESAQRCKARLERHKRIAERAANALAEKNMRDLLAQREQLEKSRLAETLDAEVRRWSSGKEGNLRALLSTLQYILWPDSGWQPIPLTEVITTASVKKSYRKATLCVHPDKLQQRGASIQQKYICEKVFDLLKEAWNKFCSEERDLMKIGDREIIRGNVAPVPISSTKCKYVKVEKLRNVILKLFF